MSKWRKAAKIDSNQPGIVKALRKIPGVTVEVGHDDIIVGYKGNNGWYEIKEPSTVGKDGNVRASEIKDSQKILLATWKGHYKIVWTLEQIIEDMGIVGVNLQLYEKSAKKELLPEDYGFNQVGDLGKEAF